VVVNKTALLPAYQQFELFHHGGDGKMEMMVVSHAELFDRLREDYGGFY